MCEGAQVRLINPIAPGKKVKSEPLPLEGIKISPKIRKSGYTCTLEYCPRIDVNFKVEPESFNVVIYQQHKNILHNTSSLMRELSRQANKLGAKVNILLVLDKDWVFTHNRKLYVKKAIILRRIQTKTISYKLVRFSWPQPAHYIATRASKKLPCLGQIDVPVSELRLFERLATNKIKTNRALGKNGIPAPRGVAFIHPEHKPRFSGHLFGPEYDALVRMVWLTDGYSKKDILDAVKSSAA